MPFCPYPLKALAILWGTTGWDYGSDCCRSLTCCQTAFLGCFGWVQHLKVLAVKWSKPGFKFYLHSLWLGQSNLTSTISSHANEAKIYPHSKWGYVYVVGTPHPNLHCFSRSSLLRRGSGLRGNAPFLVNTLDMAEKNLGREVGGKWSWGRRLEWREAGDPGRIGSSEVLLSTWLALESPGRHPLPYEGVSRKVGQRRKGFPWMWAGHTSSRIVLPKWRDLEKGESRLRTSMHPLCLLNAYKAHVAWLAASRVSTTVACTPYSYVGAHINALYLAMLRQAFCHNN